MNRMGSLGFVNYIISRKLRSLIMSTIFKKSIIIKSLGYAVTTVYEFVANRSNNLNIKNFNFIGFLIFNLILNMFVGTKCNSKVFKRKSVGKTEKCSTREEF